MRVFHKVTPTDEAGEKAAADQDAERLFRDHNADLLRFLSFKLRNESEAKEIAQEAYVRLLQLRNAGTVSFLRAYLFKIAANLAVDRLRERRVPTEAWTADAENVADSIDIERSVLAEEDFRIFLQCVDELPAKRREAFVLHRLNKLSTEEVAQRLDITPRMVRKHIARALMYCRYRIDGLSPTAATEKLNHE